MLKLRKESNLRNKGYEQSGKTKANKADVLFAPAAVYDSCTLIKN